MSTDGVNLCSAADIAILYSGGGSKQIKQAENPSAKEAQHMFFLLYLTIAARVMKKKWKTHTQRYSSGLNNMSYYCIMQDFQIV